MKTLRINGATYTFNCSSSLTKSGLIHTCFIMENGFIIHSEKIVYKKSYVSEDYKYKNIMISSIDNFVKNSNSEVSKRNLVELKGAL